MDPEAEDMLLALADMSSELVGMPTEVLTLSLLAHAMTISALSGKPVEYVLTHLAETCGESAQGLADTMREAAIAAGLAWNVTEAEHEEWDGA